MLGGTTLFIYALCVSCASMAWHRVVRLIALGAGQVAVGDRVSQEVGYPKKGLLLHWRTGFSCLPPNVH